MQIGTFIVVFTVIWWIIFFIILPIGLTMDTNHEIGHVHSAPNNPRIGKKILWTTIISFILSIITEYFIHSKLLGYLSTKLLSN